MTGYDFLVIGSGIAGLNFALGASKFGSVCVITKKDVVESNTNFAQGGIAAVLSRTDNFSLHVKDTVKTGCGLCDPKAVEIMIREAPGEIKKLIGLGVEFDKEHSKLSLSREGGHSRNRIVHTGDYTGKEIERVLVQRVKENGNITLFEKHIAVDLIVKDRVCLGCIALDKKKNKIKQFFSKVTILATGGLCQTYKNTSNPEIATGDGIAMAYRSGCEIKDMEFVQFHPTALKRKNKPHFLISETVRGEDGILKNYEDKNFMNDYHEMKDLAPRDVVSRAIMKEMGKGPVYLDIRHKGREFIKKRFPEICKTCLKNGFDLAKDLLPIHPVAHYACGGVKTGINGETSIKGLYAFGEVACTQVHGANRLASNSLLESLVFSSRALKTSKNYIKNKKISVTETESGKINREIGKTNALMERLRETMWNKVGIIRNGEGLKSAIRELNGIEKEIGNLVGNGLNPELIELRNMVLVSKLIAKSALLRKESRGVHYREDYPERDDKNWKKHIILKKDALPI